MDLQSHSDEKTLRAQFIKLSLRHHPDKGGDPETFELIKAAYKQIIDQRFRKDNAPDYNIEYSTENFENPNHDDCPNGIYTYHNDANTPSTFNPSDSYFTKIVNDDHGNIVMDQEFEDLITYNPDVIVTDEGSKIVESDECVGNKNDLSGVEQLMEIPNQRADMLFGRPVNLTSYEDGVYNLDEVYNSNDIVICSDDDSDEDDPEEFEADLLEMIQERNDQDVDLVPQRLSPDEWKSSVEINAQNKNRDTLEAYNQQNDNILCYIRND